jgi:signal transduction histidine kinase/ligand-binding sensor domain-containing protein
MVQVYVLSFAISIQFCIRKILSFVLLLLGVNTFSFSQATSFLPFTKLEIKNGLPGINVRKITKDKFGFMWFATQDGISRFDGKSFINLNSYNVDPKRKILGTDVYDIRPDKAGDYLWALSAYGGLNKIDIKTCNVINTYRVKHLVDAAKTLWYKCFQENDNSIIVGTNEGIVSLFSKKTSKTEYSFSLEKEFNCKGQLEDIMIDEMNRVWFFISGKGILITDPSCTKKVSFIPASLLSNRSFEYSDYAVFKNSLLLATTVGLYIIDIKNTILIESENTNAFIADNFSSAKLHSISIFDSAAIICGKNLIVKTNLLNWQTEKIQLAGNFEDRSWITLTNSVYFNGQTIWIGSPAGVGWIRDINSPFSAYFSSFDGQNIKINHAITICKATDSSVLVCGDDGLYLMNHHTSYIKQILNDGYYYSVFPVTKGYFIASAEFKSLKLLDSKFKPVNILSVFPELKPIKDDLLMCSAKLGDSVIFMASQNRFGLYIWDVNSGKIDTINTGTKKLQLRNNNINRLFIDSQKRLWIVCENAVSIYNHSKKTIDHIPLEDEMTKAPLSINMDICETANGFWLTSYGTGIIELSDDLSLKKIYTAKDGINNLGLYKIFNLNDSLIMASSNNGLIVLNVKNKKIKNYYAEDGLQSNSFEEASGDKSGRFVFMGGFNGITKIDVLKLIPYYSAPVLTFSTINRTSLNKTTDTLNTHISKIKIPSNISQITINFSAINYFDPEKLKFAYRIVEKDDTWNVTTNSFIQSFRLEQGKYTLQVKAITEDGIESDTKELTLIFLPKWYETFLFKALVILSIIAIAYSLYRLRINQLKKEQRIRTKLASDLHDDLGSTMNSVKVYANLAIMEKQAGKYLPLIKQGAQEAITGIRDIIWVLDDSKDTMEHLFSRISTFASPLCEANQIRYQLQITDNARSHKLKQEERRNLYMMLKEAVNNSIKYSGGQTIAIEAALQKGKPAIQIKDDGKGFAAETSSEGNGLKNMQRRAKEIKYDFRIESSPGNGATIHLEKI